MTKKRAKAQDGKSSKKSVKIDKDELDPRQAIFLKYYFDPLSETFGNGFQSAVKAGFSEEYSVILMSRMPKWVRSGKVKFDAMLDIAEQNLLDALVMDPLVQAMGPFGPLVKKVPIGKKMRGKKQKTKEVPIMVTSMKVVELKNKTSQFVAERLNKKRWSVRAEIGGEDGKPIRIDISPHIAEKMKLGTP